MPFVAVELSPRRLGDDQRQLGLEAPLLELDRS
jgi:hypothetical protein